MIQVIYEVFVHKIFKRTESNLIRFLMGSEKLRGDTDKIVPVTKLAI